MKKSNKQIELDRQFKQTKPDSTQLPKCVNCDHRWRDHFMGSGACSRSSCHCKAYGGSRHYCRGRCYCQIGTFAHDWWVKQERKEAEREKMEREKERRKMLEEEMKEDELCSQRTRTSR